MRWTRVATRNVVLTDHQEEFIEGLVSSGRYQNASEVLREGLRLIEQNGIIAVTDFDSRQTSDNRADPTRAFAFAPTVFTDPL
jgi:Arc/MetJ-type ribon-helix-helix transcriptional regulator